MADGMVGADPQQLIDLARTMREAATTLGDASNTLTGKISHGLRWHGPDADRLRSQWHSLHVPAINSASSMMNDCSDQLIKQADEQTAASAATGGPGGTGGTGGSGWPDGVKAYPPLPAKVDQSPEGMKDWWDALGDRQDDYLAEHPEFVGNTDGIPMDARAEANRISAENRLHQIENILEAGRLNGVGLDEAYLPEMNYLRQVINGQVELVAYDPKNGNLIEMIGDLTPETTTVLTYVPGTLATDDGFFDGSTQGVANYLKKADLSDGTVAFVYKNSEFPQDKTMIQSGNQEFGMAAGEKLHNFESGLGLEVPPGAQTVAVSHSWGEGAVSSSEYYGSHYDKQISLSGAWMPDEWKADPNTEYHHFSYNVDLLSFVQRAGIVAEKYPGNGPDFLNHLYQDPSGNTYDDIGDIPAYIETGAENHSLIANANDPRNRQAMQDLAKAVYQ